MIEILYKRKIIRDFLSLFSDNKWNQIIIHTLEFGILQLKLKNNLASLSIEDIMNFVGIWQILFQMRLKNKRKKKKAK